MPVENIQEDSPVLVTLPYTGTTINPLIARRVRDPRQCITVPDRYLDRLIGGPGNEVNMVRANFHRFVSDADHATPAGNLKPLRGMMGVVPLLDIGGDCIWQDPPSKKEGVGWRAMYHAPYHAAIAAQIARIRVRRGHVIILNCRALPDDRPLQHFNATPADITLSTAMGSSCDIDLATKLASVLKCNKAFSSEVSGRNTTGYTTRTYGRPATGVHALDIDIKESCYLRFLEGEGHYDPEKAQAMRDMLSELVAYVTKWQSH